MIQLTGESLGKRQQEFNKKVLEAVEKQTSFDEIQASEEQSDADKLYKIDVASHFKNIDYIVDILKCGDSLYISRALKCEFLYNDELSHIVNPDHLHHAIFPFMSLKMKTKFLNCIAANIKNEARAVTFFEYCRKQEMRSFPPKFLLRTSDTFKKDIIVNDSDYIISINLKHFIGKSFELATFYISKLTSYQKNGGVHRLSYLYTVDPEKFLNLFEANAKPRSSCVFGVRMSKSIMTKHKSRVLATPMLYVNHLNKGIVARHSTREEAKQFIIAVFPHKLEDFWKLNFYQKYKRIFNKIPNNEVLQFFKNTFSSLYGNQEFEMTTQFYDYKYYELYATEEREQWALRHVKEGRHLLGINTDYVWYTFVNFKKAFKPIKQYILLTDDDDLRNKIERVLISSARNQTDLEHLFIYFNERHRNEGGHYKDDFINEVISKHNIFTFNESCWNEFNKILYSMKVYTQGFDKTNKYRVFCIIYNIIHGKDIHGALSYYLDFNCSFGEFKTYRNHLDDDQWEQVFKYLYEYFLRKFSMISVNTNDSDSNKQEKTNIVNSFVDLLQTFKKPRGDLPAVVNLFIQENEDDFKHLKDNNVKDLKEVDLMRLLKKHKDLVLEKLPELKGAMNTSLFRLTHLIKKIRIYFSHDLGAELGTFFKECVKDVTYNDKFWYMLNTCVYGVFQLEKEDYKVEFLNRYVPKDDKIDHRNNGRVLAIQKIICRLAGCPRPPLPLSNVLQYIKGDYVYFFLPTFNKLAVNLPLPLSIKFMEAIIDAPPSIQKHGIRLAFKVYRHDNLKNLMCYIWKRTKNASVRLAIYQALADNIIYDDDGDVPEKEITKPFKHMTSSLNCDDEDGIFDLLCSFSKFPETLKVDLLKRAWKALTTSSRNKSRNITLKTRLVNAFLHCRPYNIDRDFLRSKIINKHIKNMLCKKKILSNFKCEKEELHTAMWNLTVAYVINSDSEIEFQESLEILGLILQETLKNWNVRTDDNYGFIKFFYDFFNKMKHGCVYNEGGLNLYVLPLFEHILQSVTAYSPNHEMFLLTLDIKLFIEIINILNKENGDLTQIAKDAAESLLKIIQELRENNSITPCFFSNISNLISKSIQNLCASIRTDPKLFTLDICNELVLYDDIDATIFAISIMPLPRSGVNDVRFDNLSSKFVEKVTQINNYQVQSYFYSKYYLSSAIGMFPDLNSIEDNSKI